MPSMKSLFNEGQPAAGSRGVSVALRSSGEEKREVVAIGGLKAPASKGPLRVSGLPARRQAHAHAHAAFEGKDVLRLSGFRRANLLGRFPDGRGFDVAIVRRENFLASSEGGVSGRQDRTAKRDLSTRFRWRKRPTGRAEKA